MFHYSAGGAKGRVDLKEKREAQRSVVSLPVSQACKAGLFPINSCPLGGWDNGVRQGWKTGEGLHDPLEMVAREGREITVGVLLQSWG